MKLVALWIEDFMKIKNSAFNFGSRLTFSFDFNEANNSLLISAEPTPQYFNLFSDTGIENITGIIGTNGSGKTTLLKALSTMHAEKPLMNRIVAVFESESDSKLIIHNYKSTYDIFGKQNGLKIILQELGLFEEDIPKLSEATVNTDKPPFADTDLIFYSNLYSDQNDNYLKSHDPLNRSVDYQTIKSISYGKLKEYLRIFNLKKSRKTLFIEESYNPLSIYHRDKQKRLITFLADADPELAFLFQNDIQFPNNITVWIDEQIPEKTFKYLSESFEDLEKAHDLYNFCAANNRFENNHKQQFKNTLIYSLFFVSLYNEFFKESEENGSLADIQEFLRNVSLDQSIYSQIKEFLQSQQGSRKNSRINTVKSFVERIDDLLKNIPINIQTEKFGKESYELGINKSLWRFLAKVQSISEYNDEAVLISNLDPFSAGQSAILGQFSEFFIALKHVKKQNLLITIDEGELYLHPEWQRKYVNALYTFFAFFAKKKSLNIQIIITSHSPFIVSDIPKYNVVFMAKGINATTQVFSSSEQKHTLGGNIFELFQNGFYMNEFMGDFATQKINSAINFLNDKQSSFKNLSEVESFVKLIGEDLIRDHLERAISIKKDTAYTSLYEIVKDDDFTIKDNNDEKQN